MNETFLPNAELSVRLNEGHVDNKRFMAVVGVELETAYERWGEANSWASVEVPEPIKIPSLGRALVYEEAASQPTFDYEAYNFLAYDLSPAINVINQYWDDGLSISIPSSTGATLNSANLMLGNPTKVHQSQVSMLTGQHVLNYNGQRETSQLGEITLTNIGEGDEEGYIAIHKARARCARVLASFEPLFDELYEVYKLDSSKLTRALSYEREFGKSDDGQYNPLMHTALEGLMTVGQSVELLLQPGIPGAADMQNKDASHIFGRKPPRADACIELNS